MNSPRKPILGILMLGFFLSSQAQTYIEQPKRTCLKWLAKSIGKSVRFGDAPTDGPSPLDTLCVTGFSGPASPLRLHLQFDSTSRCNLETYFFSSEADQQAYLQKILSDPKWGWKKLNENQYISDFIHQRTLEVPPENSAGQFSVIRSAWTRTLYDLLTQ